MNKVILKDFRTFEEATLPVSGVLVKFTPSPLLEDLQGLDAGKLTDGEMGKKMLVNLIKEWNLFASETDENPLPITEENLQRLPAQDIVFLTGKIEASLKGEKKD